MHPRFREIRAGLFIGFCAMLLFPAVSWAAHVSMETAIGFNGRVQLNRWAPVTIALENRGRSVSGLLEISVTAGSEYRGDVFETVYAMAVSLPYGSRKRCSFTILIRSVAHDVKVRFTAGQEVVAADTVSLKDNVIGADFALVLDRRIAANFLSAFPERVYPVRIDTRRLPNTWYGYEGVRMLILNPAMLKRLNPDQFQALRQWVENGGGLVTSPGINFGSLGEGRMKQLLPVMVNGYTRVSDMKGLETFSGQPLTRTSSLPVLDVRVEQADTLAAAAGVPLVIRKRIGRGIILFLTFDIQSADFNRWPGRKRFWEKILTISPVPDKPGRLLSQHQIADALLSAIGSAFPVFWEVVLFLAGYVTTLAILMKQAGNRERPRTSYGICLIACTILFLLLGDGVLFRRASTNRIHFNSFYLLSGNGRYLNGPGKYVFGLYTIPDRTARAEFRKSSYPVAPIPAKSSRVKTPIPFRIIDSATGQQVETHLPKWSHHLFRADMHKGIPASAQLVVEGNRLVLTVENRSAHPIQNGLVYVKGQFRFIGDIAAMETRKISFEPTPSSMADRHGMSDIAERFFSAGPAGDPPFFRSIKQRLAKDVLKKIQTVCPPDKNTALLVGWIHVGMTEPVFAEPAVRAEGITLIDWEIPIGRDHET